MPTTPKFTKEMLEGLEKQMANAQSDVEARLLVIDIGKNFPAIRDELRRLWKENEDLQEAVQTTANHLQRAMDMGKVEVIIHKEFVGSYGDAN